MSLRAALLALAVWIGSHLAQHTLAISGGAGAGNWPLADTTAFALHIAATLHAAAAVVLTAALGAIAFAASSGRLRRVAAPGACADPQ